MAPQVLICWGIYRDSTFEHPFHQRHDLLIVHPVGVGKPAEVRRGKAGTNPCRNHELSASLSGIKSQKITVITRVPLDPATP